MNERFCNLVAISLKTPNAPKAQRQRRPHEYETDESSREPTAGCGMEDHDA